MMVRVRPGKRGVRVQFVRTTYDPAAKRGVQTLLATLPLPRYAYSADDRAVAFEPDFALPAGVTAGMTAAERAQAETWLEDAKRASAARDVAWRVEEAAKGLAKIEALLRLVDEDGRRKAVQAARRGVLVGRMGRVLAALYGPGARIHARVPAPSGRATAPVATTTASAVIDHDDEENRAAG